MKNILLIIIFLFISVTALYATRFDELDKPPEGAHRGQMLLGGFVSMGMPRGDLIDAEEGFIENNTFTFSETGTTKKLMVTHLSFSFGLAFEYMPLDRIGVKTKLNRSLIIQRTIFGTDYQNWSGYLYKDYSMLLGPSIHLNVRKQWDVILSPVIGYAFARYEATPVAAQLINKSNPTAPDPIIYSGSGRKQSISGLTYGVDLSLGFYFSGGLYITLGFDWTVNRVKFGKDYNLSQITTSGTTIETYKGTSSDINNYSIILSAGYAFSN